VGWYKIKRWFEMSGNCGDGCTCDDTPIKLGDKDSCLVFRQHEDGNTSIEMYLPTGGGPEELASSAAVLCSIISIRVSDPDFIAEQYEWLESKSKEIEDLEELEKDDES